MKARDLFGLAIRLIGLAFLYQSLSAVPMAIAAVSPGFKHFIFSNLFPALFAVGWPMLAAYWLIRGAPPLMRLAYPDDRTGALDAHPTGASTAYRAQDAAEPNRQMPQT